MSKKRKTKTIAKEIITTNEKRDHIYKLQAPKPKIVVINGKKYVDRFYQIAGW